MLIICNQWIHWIHQTSDRASTPSMRSNHQLHRVLYGSVVAVILLSGIACSASDQGIHNCHDDSVGPNTYAAKPGETSQVEDSKPHRVKLSWDAPADAVQGYIIERKELGTGGDYKKISLVPIRETSCNDYEVIPGHTYLYRARSVGSEGRVSGPSNQAQAKVPRP